jgi:hypothetical protein
MSDTLIALVVSSALYLLVVGPVLAAFFYAVKRKEPGAIDRAVTDVQRFVDLGGRAHAELDATGSLDRFVELKHEARKHLWRPTSERAHSEPVSQIVRPVAAPSRSAERPAA